MRLNTFLFLPLIVVSSFPLWADGCPAGSYVLRVEHSDDEERTICKCLAGFVARGGSCVPALDKPVANLALNSHLAEINVIEIQSVQDRIDRLHKALDILSEPDREASKRWAELHKEMVKQSHEIQWQAFLFATAGLGEILKMASADNIKQAEALQRQAFWGEIPAEKARLQALLPMADEKQAAILKEGIASFDRLERAHELHDNVEMGKRLWEAMVIQAETMKRLSPKEVDPKTVNVLYESSAWMGRTAIVFGKGVVEKASTLASFAEPFAEAGGVYLMMEKEEQQLKQLSTEAADRQTKRRQIHEQLGELENRRSDLKWAIERADPSLKVDIDLLHGGKVTIGQRDKT